MAHEHEGYRELSEEEEERYETAYDLIETLRSISVDFRLVDGKVRYRPVSCVNEHGRSELRRCKAELYEILREEDEREAAWEEALATAPEFAATDDNLADIPALMAEQDEFDELSADQQRALFRWIAESLEVSPETGTDRLHDSYSLKHVFERSPEGFYVSDEQFRCAMWLSGFPGRRYPGRRYEDCESRYYYLRPKPEGLIRKLIEAGVPSGWARDAIVEAHPDPPPPAPSEELVRGVLAAFHECSQATLGPISTAAWQAQALAAGIGPDDFDDARRVLIEERTVRPWGDSHTDLWRPLLMSLDGGT
jgi:hypothetical protein